MLLPLRFLVPSCGVLALGLVALTGVRAGENDPLATLRAGHPRLIADEAAWTRLNARRATDPRLGAFVSGLEADARALLDRQPETYHKTGRRLLGVSREVLRRTLVLSLAYRTTHDERFLRRAEKEMLAMAAFSDWNPSHFLDVAEMTTALSLGYDWLYAGLSPEARVTIRDAILNKGLLTGLDPKNNNWKNTQNNWNQVCFGGMVLGALAIGDEAREPAAKLLTLAQQKMPVGLKAYVPDGVYPEGPGYWSYGTSYSVMTFAAMETALGTDWQLSQSPGFLASAGSFLQMNAPSRLFFDYSDCGERASFEPALFWFAQHMNTPGLVSIPIASLGLTDSRSQRASHEAGRFLALAALWWPEQVPAAPELPLRWHGEGLNPLVVVRSSWTDPRAFYLGLKGGSASRSHAHMDAGSFVFEVDGVRWARDLGMQDYESLESKDVKLWDMHQDSQRWTVFRLNNHSHNTLTLDGRLHQVAGVASIAGFSADPADTRAVVDLTSVFAGQAERVVRGFRVLHDRELIVQDELSGLKAGSDVCWTLVTAAQVTVDPDGTRAVLREGGRELQLQVLTPTAGTKVSVAEATPTNAYDAPNPNRRLIQVHVPAPASGALSLAVWLTPERAAKPPMLDAVKDWKIRE